MRLELGTLPGDRRSPSATPDAVRRRPAHGGPRGGAGRGPAATRASRRPSSRSRAPGESVRIWPVRDVIEPRVKVRGRRASAIPGICGRDIATVGEGRTHRLAGMGVVEVSSVNWHDSGGDFVETYLDMSGPVRRDVSVPPPVNSLRWSSSPTPTLGDEVRNDAVHKAALTVGDQLARGTCARSTPPEREVFELTPVRSGAAAGRLHLVRALAPGDVGLAHRVLHGDLRPHPAHAAVDPAPQRDPRRRAHRARTAPPSPCRGRWRTTRSSSTSTAATAATGTSSA